MVAFKARRLVRPAMSLINLITSPILAELSARPLTAWLVRLGLLRGQPGNPSGLLDLPGDFANGRRQFLGGAGDGSARWPKPLRWRRRRRSPDGWSFLNWPSSSTRFASSPPRAFATMSSMPEILLSNCLAKPSMARPRASRAASFGVLFGGEAF